MGSKKRRHGLVDTDGEENNHHGDEETVGIMVGCSRHDGQNSENNRRSQMISPLSVGASGAAASVVTETVSVFSSSMPPEVAARTPHR